MAGAQRKYAIVIWGATGYTGRAACRYVAKEYGLSSDALRYAIVGRDQAKLEAVAAEMVAIAKTAERTNGQSTVPMLYATLDDPASLAAICNQTKALVSFAGPYTKYGEPVVKACAEAGTHYTDATAEMSWVVAMQQKYGAVAEQNKAKIVPCMGGGEFMPVELTMTFLQETCKRHNYDVQSIKTYHSGSGNGISGGTIRSLACIVWNRKIWSKDPFKYCSSRPMNAIVRANRSPVTIGRLSHEHGFKWHAPFCFGRANSDYQRWSNEAGGFQFGRNLVVDHRAGCQSLLAAVLHLYFSFAYIFIGLLIGCTPTFILDGILPAPGKAFAPSKPHDEAGKLGTVLSSEAEVYDPRSKTIKKIHCRASCQYEPYYLTGISCVEGALAMALDETTPAYGVMGCTAAVGPALLPRLALRGVACISTTNDEK